jgi:hypothetical protein
MSAQLALDLGTCPICDGTGRILEVWNATKANRYGTAGKAYGCPEGCEQVPWGTTPHEKVIHHKDKP